MDEFILRCFLAVVETGSFTRAARQVKRTQSAITQQMHRLEERLGKKLFDRGKEVKLTKEGELFLSYANKIFSIDMVLVKMSQPEDFLEDFLLTHLTQRG